jgi:hypothetical protein
MKQTVTEAVTEAVNEMPVMKKSLFEKIMTKFHVIDGCLNRAADMIVKAAKTTGKAICYFLIGGVAVITAAIAVAPMETTEKAARGQLTVVEKKALQEQRDRIQKLESEGTLHRAVRKFQGRPLE